MTVADWLVDRIPRGPFIFVWRYSFLLYGLIVGVWAMFFGGHTLMAGLLAFNSLMLAFMVADRNVWNKRWDSLTDILKETDKIAVERTTYVDYEVVEDDE